VSDKQLFESVGQTIERGKQGLYGKLLQVLGGIVGLEKLGTNDHFNYSFVRNEDVLNAVRTQLYKNGVAFIISLESLDREETTGGKRSTFKTTVVLRATFACAETGETVSVLWPGEANDNQDKGISKAMTMAVKYGLLKMFLIPTVEEDELDPDGLGPVGYREEPYEDEELYEEDEASGDVEEIPYEGHWSDGKATSLAKFLTKWDLEFDEAMRVISAAEERDVRSWGEVGLSEQEAFGAIAEYLKSRKEED